MNARDHIASTIATIRKQVDGAERRIVEGNALEASGPIAGAISRLASLQVEIARLDGYETARREARAQADLDAHVRAKRGRDAITEVLVTELGWRRDVALERANNYAQVLSDAGAADTADLLAMVGATTTPDRRLQVLAHVLCAWARTERASFDIDAEGPCRAGDESRCPETSPPLAAE